MYLTKAKLKSWRESNTPDLCPGLGRPINRPVVDHDHRSGEVRAVISSEANVLIGKIENCYTRTCSGEPVDLPATLRRIADYLERGPSGILHPQGVNQLANRFKNNLTSTGQRLLLKRMGCTDEEVDSATNSELRRRLYLKSIKETYEKQGE